METLWEENPPKVKCQCDCGKIKVLRKCDVQSGHTKSCGCISAEILKRINTVDHTGKISDYGVKILNPIGFNEKHQQLWECECGFCGTHFNELPARVLNNHVRSCGCLRSSAREIFIEKVLNDIGVEYKKEYTYADCKNEYVLRFDFAIIKNSKVFYLIEYDGEQHYRPVSLFGEEQGYK